MEAKIKPIESIFDKNLHDLPMKVRISMMKKHINDEDVSWDEALRRAELVLEQQELLEKQAQICSTPVQEDLQKLLEEARLEKLFRDNMF
tara:strand:- start:2929 stop:3198 length:270 start_codon:yes stop_codon:yes gene_type:complete